MLNVTHRHVFCTLQDTRLVVCEHAHEHVS